MPLSYSAFLAKCAFQEPFVQNPIRIGMSVNELVEALK